MSLSDKPGTLRAQMKHHEPIVCFAVKTKQIDMRTSENEAHPMDDNDDKEPQTVCYSVDCRNNEINKEISGTLQAHNLGGWSVNCTNTVMYEKHEE